MISHRFPALEWIADKMRTAVPGTTVNTQLMPFDKALELATIAFSSKASTPDIIYANDSTYLQFAKNGWIRPLDDLWEKHKDEFQLDDFTPTVRKERMWNGHQWTVPATSNVMLFFYRQDLFDKAGKKPPQTFVEYRDLAKFFNSPMRAGTISCQRPVDAALNERLMVYQCPGRRLVRRHLAPEIQRRQGRAGNPDVERHHAIRPAGLYQCRERRVHDCTTAGHRGDGPAMGDACPVDGRSG